MVEPSTGYLPLASMSRPRRYTGSKLHLFGRSCRFLHSMTPYDPWSQQIAGKTHLREAHCVLLHDAIWNTVSISLFHRAENRDYLPPSLCCATRPRPAQWHVETRFPPCLRFTTTYRPVTDTKSGFCCISSTSAIDESSWISTNARRALRRSWQKTRTGAFPPSSWKMACTYRNRTRFYFISPRPRRFFPLRAWTARKSCNGCSSSNTATNRTSRRRAIG